MRGVSGAAGHLGRGGCWWKVGFRISSMSVAEKLD